MWKHLNVRDKHKYYETATKARSTYDLPEYAAEPPGKMKIVQRVELTRYLDSFKTVPTTAKQTDSNVLTPCSKLFPI